MRPPDHLKPQGVRFNLTPMIDMVFLLIIFFIVSNNMIQQDNAIPVDLPGAETGILPQEQQQAKRLIISIPRPGALYVGPEPLDTSALPLLMADCRTHWGEEAEIRIRTDKNVLFGEISPILRMAAESGIIHVSFAVSERSGAE